MNIENNGSILKKCQIISTGENNTLILPAHGIFRNCEFVFHGDNNIIEFGDECLANQGSFCIENSQNRITVGKHTTFWGKIHLAAIEGTTISIGNDCLFSSEIVFRTGDSHSITDLGGNRINKSKDIIIKDHVWIGYRVLLTKGVVISENSIVGTGSVLTKQFDEKNVVIAGVPAKIINRNVNWDARRV